MVEREKEYVQAARVIGRRPLAIMLSHVLPNVMGPVLVLATINIATAIITEATLSFLGVGVPATRPSLGTLIRVGNEFLYSGEWWITVFPGAALVILVLSVNLLGDWLRDALNPRLSMILEVEHLKVEFPTRRGTLTAVDDVSFSIAPGEVLGVVGESGAGKSHHRHGGDRPARSARAHRRRRGAARGPAHRQPAARRAAQHPRAPDRRDLPGPAHLAQSALHHRPAARGNHPHAPAAQPRAGARARAIACCGEVGIPAPEARFDNYPHQFQRRHAPARGDRARPRRRAAPADRRRADHRARRLDPGADHRAAQAPVPPSAAPR